MSAPILTARLRAKDETSKVISGAAKRITGSLKRIGEIAAGVLTRDLVRGLTSAAKESVALGAKAETLRRSFDRLRGPVDETDLSLEGLKEAVGDTVSEIDLLTAANQAMALGLPKDELDELFGAAQKVGAAMGRTTLEAVQDLTTGIGRQSRLILDNLGIIVDTEAAYETFASTIGKTASELTDAERKTAFMTAAIDSLNEKAEILGDNVSDVQKTQEAFSATITNLKTKIGEFLIPVLTDLSEKFLEVVPSIESMIDVIRTGDFAKIADFLKKQFDTGLKKALELFDQFKKRVMAIDWNEVFTELLNYVGNIGKNIVDWAGDQSAYLLELFAGVDWGSLFENLMSYAMSIGKTIVSYAGDQTSNLESLFDSVDWDKIFSTLATYVTGIGSKVVGWAGDQTANMLNLFGDIDWDAAFQSLDDFVSDIATWLKPILEETSSSLQTNLSNWISTVDWDAVFESLGTFAAKMPKWLAESIPQIGIYIAQQLEKVDWETTFQSVMDAFGAFLRGFWDELFESIPKWFQHISGIRSERAAKVWGDVLELYGGQHGLSMTVSKPTMFLAGEAGPESVSITPLSGGGTGGGGDVHFNIGTFIGLDEESARIIAESSARYYMDELRRLGVRT